MYDVRQFGAKGDGKIDDTKAVQSAIEAALKAHGGRVHFPSGRYRITRSLTFGSQERIDITGDGMTSVLLHDCDEHLLLWKEGVACREVSVRNLCFTSIGKDKPVETAAIACLSGVERSFFHHLFFNAEGGKMGSGVIVDRVADSTTFDHCLMWGVHGTGIRLARGSEVRVFGGRIIGSDERWTNKSIGVHLTGNNGGVHVVTTDLIALNTAMKIGEPNSQSNREVFITHATFDSSVHGVVQTDFAYTSIAGCWSASSDEEQILLDESAVHAVLTVTGGTIFNGGAYGKPGAHNGIVVKAGTFSLNGVTVRHNKGTGIVAGRNVRDYTITGCRIHDNGTGAVLDGDSYTFTGNLLTRNGTQLADNGGPNKVVQGNVVVPANG